MKRKAVIMLLTLCMTAAAVGCGDKAKNSTSENKDSDKKTEAVQDDKKEEDKDKEENTDPNAEITSVKVDDLKKYVTLGEYKGLEGEKSTLTVSDAEVEYQIEGQMKYNAQEVTDRPAQEGDIVNISYVGKVDGKEFEGGKGSNYDLELGSKTFIEGFEEGLVGVTKGQELDINVTFPDPYQNNTELSGKPAVFSVSVNSISKAPELTDEWVASNTEYKTVDEYKAAMKDMLQESSDGQSDYYLKNGLFNKVMENSTISDYPEDLLTTETENYKKQIEQYYGAQAQMTLDDLISAQGITVEEFENMAKEKAKERLGQKMIVQAIMDAEGMHFTQADYDKLVDEYVKNYKFQSKEAMISQYGEDVIKDNILWDKVCEVLIANANITQVDGSEQGSVSDGSAPQEGSVSDASAEEPTPDTPSEGSASDNSTAE